MIKNNKRIVFLSNYFNHHQKPFSDCMYDLIGDGYSFVETDEMSQERKSLGYHTTYPDYVIKHDQFEVRKDEIIKLINEADAVITGSAPNWLIKERKKKGALVLKYSERPFKKIDSLWKRPLRYIKWHLENPKKSNVYLLCASAYTAQDYASYGLFKGKTFKWGYFPEFLSYDEEQLIEQKEEGSIMWCARFIDWKHPEKAVELAKRLKQAGYKFKLNMIGNGEMLEEIKDKIKDLDLEDCVYALGSMKPEEVRTYMEKSQVFIFTSDRQEGWGAVLNEAMNSGCAVVADKDIGSAPYLIKNDQNGLLYDGSIEDLERAVRFILDNE